jgi:hypothetical protein
LPPEVGHVRDPGHQPGAGASEAQLVNQDLEHARPDGGDEVLEPHETRRVGPSPDFRVRATDGLQQLPGTPDGPRIGTDRADSVRHCGQVRVIQDDASTEFFRIDV